MKNNNSKFKSIVRSKARWLVALLALLTLGGGQMWGQQRGHPMEEERLPIPHHRVDTTIVYTPDLSTADTIYLRYDKLESDMSNWVEVGRDIVILLLGAFITFLTTIVTQNRERKYKKHDLITDDAIAKEQEVFDLIIQIKNTTNPHQKKTLLEKLDVLLQKSQLLMEPELRKIARDIYTYYYEIHNNPDVVPIKEKERELIET